MVVKDLLEQDICKDVCDDYDERCWIAFVGPMKLTEEGEKKFSQSLSVPIALWGDTIGLLVADRIPDEDHEEAVENLHELFLAMAGYCSKDNYNKWFEEVRD